MRLPVDAIGEVEGHWIAGGAPAAEHQVPKASRRVAGAGVDGDRALELPVVASKALISLSTKLKLPTSKSPPNGPKPAGAVAMPTGRRASSPGPVTQVAAEVALSSKRPPLLPAVALISAGAPGRRVSHVNLAAYVLHVEGDESGGRVGSTKPPGTVVSANEPLYTSMEPVPAPLAA